MNGKLRCLMVGGMGAAAVLWATRPGVARVAPDSKSDKECTSTACASEAKNELRISSGSSRVFNASSEIHRGEVADPDIAGFVRYSPKQVGIVGLMPGDTTVSIWSAASAKPVTIKVRVLEVQSDDAQDDADIKQATHRSALPAAMVAGPGLPLAGKTNYVQNVPTVSIESSSPMTANVGKVVEQQILVKNVGAVSAEQVEVRGTVSIDSELISTEPKARIENSTMVWRFSKIPAGGQQKIVVQVKPLVAGELSCHTNVSFKSSSSVKVQVGEPKLKLTCDGPSAVVVGSDVRVIMTVANTGSAMAEGVRIRQVVPGITQTGGHVATPLTMEVGNLEVGESRVLETVSKAQDPGLVRINLVAECQDGVQATVEHQVKVQAPKLALATTGPDFRYMGHRASYQMVLANPGDATATNVNVLAGLPEGLEFVDASGAGIYNAEKRTIGWNIGVLEPGQKREFTVTVVAKSEGQHLQRAVAWADNNLLVKSDKVTRVEGAVSLVMEVVDTEDPVEVGSDTTYQIHIANRGSKSAENIQIAATVPDGMKVIGVEGPGRYRVQGQHVLFESIPSLASQSDTVLQVKVQGVQAGIQKFRAVMSCPTLTNPIITEESTQVYGD